MNENIVIWDEKSGSNILILKDLYALHDLLCTWTHVLNIPADTDESENIDEIRLALDVYTELTDEQQNEINMIIRLFGHSLDLAHVCDQLLHDEFEETC